MPKVRKKRVMADRAIMSGETCKKRFVAETESSPTSRRGIKATQNLPRHNRLGGMGALLGTQKVLPSRLIAGNAKRIAIEARTSW